MRRRRIRHVGTPPAPAYPLRQSTSTAYAIPGHLFQLRMLKHFDPFHRGEVMLGMWKPFRPLPRPSRVCLAEQSPVAASCPTRLVALLRLSRVLVATFSRRLGEFQPVVLQCSLGRKHPRLSHFTRSFHRRDVEFQLRRGRGRRFDGGLSPTSSSVLVCWNSHVLATVGRPRRRVALVSLD